MLNDETFSPIAPYYIAQIYYLQKKFKEVIDFAPPLMDSITEKRSAEMAKIIGDSYFYLEEYESAIPYLQMYRDEVGRIPVADKYQLAYAYYMTGDFEEASRIFERISMTNTEISQSALYHLADCFMKLGDKKRARSAFSSAARMDYNQKIKEDALFNYAKVTYELSYSPFNEAVRAFNSYISQYPASPRVDEAYNFLVMAYMNTRNYRMALESLEKIKEKDAGIEKAYQKVAFYRGMEIFTNQRYNDAITVFDRSLKYEKYDSRIKARTLYWLGESYQMTGDSETAGDFYRLFLNEPASFQTPEHKMVTYSLGYMEFKDQNYSEAERWFREYVNLESDKNSTTISDAYNRLGDCRFVSSKYWQAIEYYDKVIETGKADVDYAYFQKGFSLGLVDRPQGKIETLTELTTRFPNSAFVDDSYFEMGRSYVLLDNMTKARENYLKVVDDFPGSPYMSRSLTQLGLIAKNANRNAEALEYYKKVVSDYPGGSEASNALKSIKDIYVNLNDVDGYLAYVEEIGRGVSRSEQDSLLYITAENSYLAGNCEKAVTNLTSYLERFPNGSFRLDANYYLADCLLKLNRGEEAYESLLYIIEQPVSMFTEPALVAASRIAFRREEYNQAASIFSRIIEIGEKKTNIRDAEIGLMRCYVELGEYQNTIQAANQVLLQDKLDNQIEKEAKYNIANAYFQQHDVNAAYDWYKQLAVEVNSRYGAEAKFRTAQISFNKGETDVAEEIIFEFIDMNTPHQYWMGKSFLLLSDIYLEKNDDFQAVQTLESVINYYTIKDDGIIEEAVYKKEQITDRVNSESGEEEQEEIDIEPIDEL